MEEEEDLEGKHKWICFSRDFDWDPVRYNGDVTVAFKGGTTVFCNRWAAAAAIAAGAGVECERPETPTPVSIPAPIERRRRQS